MRSVKKRSEGNASRRESGRSKGKGRGSKGKRKEKRQ